MSMERALPGTIGQRARRALHDGQLRSALQRSTTGHQNHRAQAFAKLNDAAGMRQRARAAKARAIANLPALLDQLQAQVEARGGHVYRAADAAEVARIVLAIADAKQLRRVVKSKSMVSEEIGLNERLERAGLQVTETDLGEYIVQLAGELPSHILAPAAHKNRAQISALLSREAGRPLGQDTRDLTRAAREMLRERFLAADLGISGGNVLVAETGTLVLVTNEGNGRMVTSLPRVHVAIVGIEKVVASWQDLAAVLEVLPRSATGQALSVYVSCVTGPRAADEADGPDEFHLILLDNGRSQLRGTRYEEVLYCLRCSACLNVCPVFRQVGGHTYGGPYSGPIGAVLTPLLDHDRKWQELPQLSSLCGSCTEHCPVGIRLHEHLVHLRQEGVARGSAPLGERALMRAWAWAWSHAARYRGFVRLARLAQRPFQRGDGLAQGLPGPLGQWTAARAFPPLAETTFRERWATREGRRS